MRKGSLRVFLASALTLSVGNAAAETYSFSNLYEISSGPFLFFDFPSLNNSGTVAFWATLDTGEEVIFTGNGGPLTTIADTSGPFEAFVGNISLNDSGTVAFNAFLDAGGPGIFTGNGGPVTTIADTSGPFSFFFQSGAQSLNNSGTVAFNAFLDTGGFGIFTGNGGPTTTIAEGIGTLSLNKSGTVAVVSNNQGIFTGNGGPTTTIADESGPFSFFPNPRPSLNDSGTVAFLAGLDTGEGGIFTGSGGPTTTIADDSGPFSTFFFGPDISPSLNDSGTVAFLAVLDTGDEGIFTGPDPLADEVIGTGDTLFGSTVTSVTTGSEWLNDNGQIAFIYRLADGRFGVARADPLAVPEPGTLALLGLGLAGLGFTRRRRAA